MQAESWQRLARAAKYYGSRNFVYRDLQWCVPPEISAITKPTECVDVYLGNYDVVLVGSAEQSFLSEYNSLDAEKLYYAITPCFRDETDYSEITRPYFMKLELFTKDTSKLEYIIRTAQIFFNQELPFLKSVDREFIDVDSYDLSYRGIELGSYCTREHKDEDLEMKWACGTGLAEPRFTQALGK